MHKEKLKSKKTHSMNNVCEIGELCVQILSNLHLFRKCMSANTVRHKANGLWLHLEVKSHAASLCKSITIQLVKKGSIRIHVG